MSSTVESTNTKINDKIGIARMVLEDIRPLIENYLRVMGTRVGKKFTDAAELLRGIHVNLLLDDLVCIEDAYSLSVVSVLSNYYTSSHHEDENTKEYYRIIGGENFVGRINAVLEKTLSIIDNVYKFLAMRVLEKSDAREAENIMEIHSNRVSNALKMDISTTLEKRNYEICKCGTRMIVIPELSDLICPEESCGRTKKIIGAVFRDDQFFPQEGQKTKHGGYDELRHYKFWIERLQALEKKSFEESDLRAINYVIDRDGYMRDKELNCEIMREVLKDPDVSCTHLNDHAPLLVKICGGQPPPQLNFQENNRLEAKFLMVMKLYDQVNPEGGNKPYYPYFIYKLVESEFADDCEKLRLLDFIHLQSRETVVKNDQWWELICAETTGSSDEIFYVPTDPARCR